MAAFADTNIGSPEMQPFDICVTSDEMSVRSALEQIFTKLSPLSLDAEELATIELVLAEAMNNIVEHAYPAHVPRGPTRIQCLQKSNGLHFTVMDAGQPMPDGQMPHGQAQRVDVDPFDMPEGGYGWFLIKDLAKDIQYQRVGEENQLNLRIAVAIHRR